jgi:hypothetical protein
VSSLEVGTDLILGRVTGVQRRKAALHIADQVAAEHPDLTAQQIAADPALSQGLRELLDIVLGTQHSRPATIHGGTA